MEITKFPKGVKSMNKIRVSLDKESRRAKPTDIEAAQISNKIGGSVRELNSIQDLKMLVSSVGRGMHTFCPPTFKDGIHDRAHFEQQQIFALDFDNKDPKNTVSFEQIKAQAEVDPQSKSLVQMYFGGENVIYTGLTRNSCPMISVESVVRNTVNFLKNKYGAKHYKPYVTRLADYSASSILETEDYFIWSYSGLPLTWFRCRKEKINSKKFSALSPIMIIGSRNIPSGNRIFAESESTSPIPAPSFVPTAIPAPTERISFPRQR